MLRTHGARRARTSVVPFLVVSVVLAGLAGCREDSLPTEPDVAPEAASMNALTVGADDWIVVFKPGTADAPGLARRLVAANGGTVRRTYAHALQGFAGNLPPQAVEAIGKNPNVNKAAAAGITSDSARFCAIESRRPR